MRGEVRVLGQALFLRGKQAAHGPQFWKLTREQVRGPLATAVLPGCSGKQRPEVTSEFKVHSGVRASFLALPCSC